MAPNNLRFRLDPSISLTRIHYLPPPCLHLCPIIGAHLNPAVTLSFCVLGKVTWERLVPYCLSQLLGAYMASGLVYLVYYGMTLCHLKNFIIDIQKGDEFTNKERNK